MGFDSDIGAPTAQTELVLLNLQNCQTEEIADVDTGPFGCPTVAATVRRPVF